MSYERSLKPSEIVATKLALIQLYKSSDLAEAAWQWIIKEEEQLTGPQTKLVSAG